MTTDRGDGPSPSRPRHRRRERYPDLSPQIPKARPVPAASWPAWTDLPIEAHDLVAVDPDTEEPLGRYETPIQLPLFGRAGRAS